MIKLPDIEYLQRLSRSILTDFEATSVTRKLEEIVRYYELINYDLSYDWPIWRARKCLSPEGYENVCDLSYPPNQFAKPGRLNNPKEPILYASLSNFSALAEIGAEEGDHVHLIGYKIKNGDKIRCGIVGEVFNVQRSGRAKISEHLGAELNRILSQMSPQVSKSFVFLDAFLSSILGSRSASDSDYLHSRTLSQLLLKKMPTVHAIWYSGIALDGAVNLAVRPDVADEIFEVAGITVVRINKKYDFGIMIFQLSEIQKHMIATE